MSEIDELRAALEAAERERDRLQHYIDCVDTPLMRDVLAERDALKERAEKSEREAKFAFETAEMANETAAHANARADALKEQVEAAREALRRIADNAGAWHGPPPDDSGHVRALAVIERKAISALARLDQRETAKCSGYCVGTSRAETLVEDLACPIHGIKAQEEAAGKFPDRQAWLDSLDQRETGADDWSEYHEFRKRTDPPPYGQGLDDVDQRETGE